MIPEAQWMYLGLMQHEWTLFCFVLLLAADYVPKKREAEWEVFGGESEVRRQLETQR